MNNTKDTEKTSPNPVSFNLLTKYQDKFLALSDEDAGKLIKAIVEFVNDPENEKPLYGKDIAFLFNDIKYSIKNYWSRHNPSKGTYYRKADL